MKCHLTRTKVIVIIQCDWKRQCSLGKLQQTLLSRPIQPMLLLFMNCVLFEQFYVKYFSFSVPKFIKIAILVLHWPVYMMHVLIFHRMSLFASQAVSFSQKQQTSQNQRVPTNVDPILQKAINMTLWILMVLVDRFKTKRGKVDSNFSHTYILNIFLSRFRKPQCLNSTCNI